METIGSLQDRVKSSSSSVGLVIVKVITGLILGLTFALIGQEVLDYGWFSFILVIVVTLTALLRIMRSWNWAPLLIFNLICVLIGLVLRMYILIAPG